jgi:hypothetical protein
MSVLSDELEDLEDDLESAKNNVGNDPGPLSEPAKTSVALRLTSAQGHIVVALPLINNAGTADTNNLPRTLPGIADECLTLSTDAHGESLKANPNHTLIGDKIKTINHIIDARDGYRDKAGIT